MKRFQAIPWTHVASPNGWVVARPGQILFLSEAWALPQHRAMDIGQHAKTLSAGVTKIVYDRDELRSPFTLYNPVLGRKYMLQLRRTKESLAPLSYMAHELVVACEDDSGREVPCDLSVLFALASPRYMPDHAAKLFRLFAVLAIPQGGDEEAPRNYVYKAPEREATWAAWAPPELVKEAADPETWKGLTRRPLDCLANPECLLALVTLVYDLSEESRCVGAKLGLWKNPPHSVKCPGGEPEEREVTLKDVERVAEGYEHGCFTFAAQVALLFIGHWLPTHKVLQYRC